MLFPANTLSARWNIWKNITDIPLQYGESVKVPVNTLYPTPLTVVPEWSSGRWQMFSRCRREFCFHYLAARGGWDMEMPEMLRELYRLKHLTTIERDTEDILRNTVEELSASSWHGRKDGYAAAFFRHGFRAAASRIRALANLDFYRDPAGCAGWQELELDGWDFDDAVRSFHDSFQHAAELFLDNYQEVFSAVEPVEWLRQEPVVQFVCSGITIYLRRAPVWMKQGSPVWLEMAHNAQSSACKTGGDEWRRYWIYNRYRTEPARISILFYDIPTGKTYSRDMMDFDFTGARELVYKEAAVMMEWVQEAVSTGFDVMESVPESGVNCGKCRFREFCRRHGSVNL